MNWSDPNQPLMSAARRPEQTRTPQTARNQGFASRAMRASALALSLSVSMVGLLMQVACGPSAAQNEPATASAQDPSAKAVPATTGASSTSPSGGSATPAPEPPLDAQAVQKACGNATHFECGLKLARELNLSKTENGYTVKINRVYADAAYLIVQYEVIPPAGDKSDPRSIDVSIQVGARSIEHIIQREMIGGPPPPSPPPPPPPGQLMTLDAGGGGGFVGDPATSTQRFQYFEIGDIKSHAASLSFSASFVIQKTAPPSPPSEPQAGPTPPGRGGPSAAPPRPSKPPKPGANPGTPSFAPPDQQGLPPPPPSPPLAFVSFDITVPVQPSQVIDLKQSHSAGGVTYTLERVIVTPLVTQVYTKKHRPATKALPVALMMGEEIVVDVSVGDLKFKAIGTGSGMSVPSKGEGWAVQTIVSPSLFGKEGEWTLTMKEIDCGGETCRRDRQAGGLTTDLTNTKKIAGPFDFRFTPPKPAR